MSEKEQLPPPLGESDETVEDIVTMASSVTGVYYGNMLCFLKGPTTKQFWRDKLLVLNIWK